MSGADRQGEGDANAKRTAKRLSVKCYGYVGKKLRRFDETICDDGLRWRGTGATLSG